MGVRQKKTEEMTMEKEYSPMISQNMADFGTPGVVIELDPDEAETWGAFAETAITEQDALDSETEGDAE